MTRRAIPSVERSAGRGAPQPPLRVELRPATEHDYAFTERLYVQTMRPLLQKLGAWDEVDVLGRFKTCFAAGGDVRIICVDGIDAGFLQTSETETEINLDQIHLNGRYRSLGIGSHLIRDLQRAAVAKHKSLALAVVHGNPALALYQRLGFVTTDQDATKLYMRHGHVTSNTPLPVTLPPS
jgi:ribosomal protein S18 acetylase RimI-like enzyme